MTIWGWSGAEPGVAMDWPGFWLRLLTGGDLPLFPFTSALVFLIHLDPLDRCFAAFLRSASSETLIGPHAPGPLGNPKCESLCPGSDANCPRQRTLSYFG